MNPEIPDLAGLVVRAQTGDLPAQEVLVRRYQQPMAAFVFALTGRADAIEDLAQEIFLRVVLKLRQLREPERFEAWMYRLARNVCRDYFRREKWRKLLLPFAAEHEEVAALSAPGGEMEAFLHALQTLPPAQRELLVLLQEREWSYEELARITGSTVSAVKSRLFRARTELKRMLADE